VCEPRERPPQIVGAGHNVELIRISFHDSEHALGREPRGVRRPWRVTLRKGWGIITSLVLDGLSFAPHAGPRITTHPKQSTGLPIRPIRGSD
jgi:hypothetical protein